MKRPRADSGYVGPRSRTAGGFMRNLPRYIGIGYNSYKRLRTAYNTGRTIGRAVKTAVRYGYGGSGSKTKTKRKPHRPMPLTPDEILRCKYTVRLGRSRFVRGVGRYRYLTNDKKIMGGLPGEQQTDLLQVIMDKTQFDTLASNIRDNSTTQVNLDQKWFLVSAYQTHQILNNANVSCKVVIRFCIAKENIDTNEDNRNPLKCWEQSEYAQQNSLSPTFTQNIYAHGPNGTLFNHFWKVLKTCHFSLGPMSTKEVSLAVLYNQFVNELQTSGIGGSEGAIRRLTIYPMITVHGSPTIARVGPSPGVPEASIARAGVVITSSTSYVYKSLSNRGKYFTFEDNLTKDEATDPNFPNPDVGQAIVETILT